MSTTDYEPFTEGTPFAIQRAALRVVQAYGIRGLCDPQYIANVIANELGLGDGASNFHSWLAVNPTECSHRGWTGQTADRRPSNSSYPLCPECVRGHERDVARWQETAGQPSQSVVR